tara:strand:- start:1036 stop:2127 length:1092 start_codon:yes stop_codon:yes gene_type:complete
MTTRAMTTRAMTTRERANDVIWRQRRVDASTRRARARRERERCATMKMTSSATAGPSDAPRERYGVTERYWTWRGRTIRYTCAGESGEAVVLVHGFGGNADHWRRNVNALSARGRRVFAIDLLGYGYSDKPDPMRPELEQNEIYCFETWGAQICDFVDDVVGVPAFVACNSVGGVAGLQAAVDAPEKIKGVVLMNVSLRGLHVTKQPPFARPFIKALQRTLRETAVGKSFFGSVAKARTVKNILKEAYGDSSQVTDELVEAILTPGLRDGAAEVFLDFISYSGGPLPEELLPKCEVPVRMFWGEKDPWENIDEGRKLYASYADKFIPLPGVGHCPQDEAPELVNALLNEFIDDYAATAKTRDL